ncbi:hypothetical protein, partial [Pseudomonas sp. 2995-1]|uniref:hypothetical protein n=1 Tax=Pseudomonas sp. 2995-1 TaxID=1712679 RepID=UPI001C475AC6
IQNQIKQKLQEHYFVQDYFKNIESLLKNREKIIPFIGAGLSMPFGVPNWAGLLKKLGKNFSKERQRETYEEDFIESGDYLGALD